MGGTLESLGGLNGPARRVGLYGRGWRTAEAGGALTPRKKSTVPAKSGAEKKPTRKRHESAARKQKKENRFQEKVASGLFTKRLFFATLPMVGAWIRRQSAEVEMVDAAAVDAADAAAVEEARAAATRAEAAAADVRAQAAAATATAEAAAAAARAEAQAATARAAAAEQQIAALRRSLEDEQRRAARQASR